MVVPSYPRTLAFLGTDSAPWRTAWRQTQQQFWKFLSSAANTAKAVAGSLARRAGRFLFTMRKGGGGANHSAQKPRRKRRSHALWRCAIPASWTHRKDA